MHVARPLVRLRPSERRPPCMHAFLIITFSFLGPPPPHVRALARAPSWLLLLRTPGLDASSQSTNDSTIHIHPTRCLETLTLLATPTLMLTQPLTPRLRSRYLSTRTTDEVSIVKCVSWAMSDLMVRSSRWCVRMTSNGGAVRPPLPLPLDGFGRRKGERGSA